MKLVKMGSYWGGVGPQTKKTDVLIRRQPLEDREMGRMCVRWMQREERLIHRPRSAKDGRQPPDTGSRTWSEVSFTALRRNRPNWHLDYGLPAPRTVKEYISVVLSHPTYGILLHGSREASTGD